MPRFQLSDDEVKFLNDAKKLDQYWNNKNNSNINTFNYYNSNGNISSSNTMKLGYIGPSCDNVVVGQVSLWNSQK